jgi:hypothetical protein
MITKVTVAGPDVIIAPRYINVVLAKELDTNRYGVLTILN